MSFSISSTPQYAQLQTLSAPPVTAPIAKALNAAEVTTPLQPDNASSKTPADSEALFSKSTFNQEALNQKLSASYDPHQPPKQSAAEAESEKQVDEMKQKLIRQSWEKAPISL